MRIVFCWSNISGYMAACWRELAGRDGVELHVIAYGDSKQSNFGEALMEGISWTPLSESERMDGGHIRRTVEALQPELIVIAGWLNDGYMKLATGGGFPHVRFVMGMDTPWLGSLRQKVARYAIRHYLDKLSAVFVPGERAWQFAQRLGIPSERIHRGMYGVDWAGMGEAHEARAKSDWPRRFLYAGRYATEKRVDLLIKGYRHYRNACPDPWELHVCGMGELEPLLRQEPGVVDHGFLQPAELRSLMGEVGALILASQYDPWPLVVVEAAAAGLPLLVTEACGSAVDVLRTEYNGLLVPSNVDGAGLATAMERLAARSDLVDWGERSRALAAPFDARFWCDRWLAILGGLVKKPSPEQNGE